MLDLSTKEWTDKSGEVKHITQLEDAHLLNIQRFLKRLLAGKDTYKANMLSSMSATACAYDSMYCDKDWYIPGSAFHDIEDLADIAVDNLQVSLMLISAEVNKRGLVPLTNLPKEGSK